MGALTDESVDIFYSCALCQSYAPNHICIITPERLGLCGAYNWLDGKAAYEINPHGGNQPVRRARWSTRCSGSGRASTTSSRSASNGAFERFSAYSMITDPMTSCGCFECIACVLPGTAGIMIVDREYPGQTPVGMTFSTLAEMTGGGQQTPGLHRHRHALHPVAEVHQRRRRARAARLDDHAHQHLLVEVDRQNIPGLLAYLHTMTGVR